MIFLLLGVMAYNPPEDSVSYYGVDLVWWQFSRQWDEAYDTSLSAFRTAQGSYDMFYWYQHTEGKVELPCISFFSLRYVYEARFNFQEKVEYHRIEPTFRIFKDFYAHLMISPFYDKRYDEMGAGLSYRPSTHNWIYFYGIMQGFDHNNSMRNILPGPNKDPYGILPFRFEIDGRGELPWLRARLQAELGTHSRQYLDWPDSSYYVWYKDHDRSTISGSLEFQPLRDVWIGAKGAWLRERERTEWPDQDSVIADTILNRWIQPYIFWQATNRINLIGQYRLECFEQGMDSLHYRRNLDVISFMTHWQPFDFLGIEAGYEKFWRYRFRDGDSIPEVWNMSHTHARFIFNAELRFKSGVSFIVKEGIKGNDPFDTFKRFHAHTSVHIYIPLAFINELGKK
jgi:hypothetical protein